MITQSLKAAALFVCSLLPGSLSDGLGTEYQFILPKSNVASSSVSLPKEPHDITVFVHGSRIFPKFYYQELFYSPEGFTKVSQLEAFCHMHTIAKELTNADPKRFNEDSFYAFGWSGKLCFYERRRAAKRLYDSLKLLIDDYKNAFGRQPKIRLITHSHGGNVALNLVYVAKEVQDDLFRIHELILLGVPCQEATKDFATNPLFERVYSLSSKFDFIQVIDPQGLYGINQNNQKKDEVPFFSERYLPFHPHIAQARIKMFGRYILHIEFLMRRAFLSKLPGILDVMDEWYAVNGISQKTSSDIPIVNINYEEIKVIAKSNGLKFFNYKIL